MNTFDIEKVQRLINLVILRDEFDKMFDDFSTETMLKHMDEYRQIERDMVLIARELDNQ